MYASCDKENSFSGSSLYDVPKGYKPSGGFMALLKEAHTEAVREMDEEVATQVARESDVKEKVRRAEEEKAGFELAARLHLEDKDAILAAELAAREEEEVKHQEEKRRIALADLAEADAKLVEQLKREDENRAKTLMSVEKKDMKAARKLQRQESDRFKKSLKETIKAWRKPVVDAQNVKDGMAVTVKLPYLGDVALDTESKTDMIVLKAAPDFLAYDEHAKELPEELNTLPVNLTLDLKIIGSVKKADLSVDKKRGIVTVFVPGAKIKEEAGFMRRFLKRVFK